MSAYISLDSVRCKRAENLFISLNTCNSKHRNFSLIKQFVFYLSEPMKVLNYEKVDQWFFLKNFLLIDILLGNDLRRKRLA